MEKQGDINNIEKYVQKELDNERKYRERLSIANKRMAKNADHLITSVTHDYNARQDQ